MVLIIHLRWCGGELPLLPLLCLLLRLFPFRSSFDPLFPCFVLCHVFHFFSTFYWKGRARLQRHTCHAHTRTTMTAEDDDYTMMPTSRHEASLPRRTRSRRHSMHASSTFRSAVHFALARDDDDGERMDRFDDDNNRPPPVNDLVIDDAARPHLNQPQRRLPRTSTPSSTPSSSSTSTHAAAVSSSASSPARPTSPRSATNALKYARFMLKMQKKREKLRNHPAVVGVSSIPIHLFDSLPALTHTHAASSEIALTRHMFSSPHQPPASETVRCRCAPILHT